MARLIARDATVEIQFGGFDDGGNPTWGTATAIHGIAREVSVEQRANAINLAGLNDLLARMRFAGTASQTLRISLFIPTDGFWAFGAPPASPIGSRARVNIKPRSTLTTPFQFEGVVTRWQWSTQAGEAQVEEIEIEGPLDN